MPFLDTLDIANRACDHMGVAAILDVDEDSVQNAQITRVYDKIRRVELRRNIWTCATRRAVLRSIDTTTRFIAPDLYDETVTYRPGAIVKDANRMLWQSMEPDNVGNAPATTSAWEGYFGPLSVSLYDEDESYFAGEMVYQEVEDPGSFAVFLSLESENEDDPTVTTDWDVATTYRRDDVVTYSGSNWRSKIEVNTGITPVEPPADWDADAAYVISDTVTASDGYKYTALGNTTGDDPAGEANPSDWTRSTLASAWTALPEQYSSSMKWLPIFAALSSARFMYPVGTGPVSNRSLRNVYRLPSGFLRTAPQNAKAGGSSTLGAPTNDIYRDWEYEGNYLVTLDAGPILFRFVADLQEVSSMDDMFCEGLGARLALECISKIAQSSADLKDIAGKYEKFMKEARLVNAIEMGTIEQPLDDYLACRG